MKKGVLLSLVMGAVMVGVLMVLLGLGASNAYAEVNANPAIDLEQCVNGRTGVEHPTCSWERGNVNGQKAQYAIGDWLSYRMIFTNMVPGYDYCMGVKWDVAKGPLPALDYVGTTANANFNSVPVYPDIVQGTSYGPGGIYSGTAAVLIPMDPDPLYLPGLYQPIMEGYSDKTGTYNGYYTGTGAYITGHWTTYGAAPTGAYPTGYSNEYSPTNNLTDNFVQSVQFCFTAVNPEVVYSWAAHIALPEEWNLPKRPTGSPYHTAGGTDNFCLYPRTLAQNSCDSAIGWVPPEGQGDPDTSNIGALDLQLDIDEPTAITLVNVTAQNQDGSGLVLAGAVVLGLALITLLLTLRRYRPTEVIEKFD